MSTEEFAGFLARLDPDRTRAAEKYVALRHKLVKVLERTPCDDPEGLADEAVDRIARKLEEETIHNLTAFAYGVVRKISLEVGRNASRFVSIHDRYESEDSLIGEADPESRILQAMQNETGVRCLNKCLRRMPLQDQELLLEYYRGEKQVRIECRQKLARELGISLADLRRRMNTLRDKLKACIHRCLGADRLGANRKMNRRI